MVRLIQLAWFIARLATPWIVRAVAYTVWLCLLAIASFWVGIPNAVDQIANSWLDRAILAGFPTQWDRQLYYVLWTLAFQTIVLAWVVFSFTTVFIVRLIF